MDRAQKGDSPSGYRQIKGRMDDQNPGADRCIGQSGAVHPDAGKSLRHGRRGALDQRAEVRRPARPLSWFASKPLPGNGQGLRQQPDHRGDERARGLDLHFTAPAATASMIPSWPASLNVAEPDLPQA